MDEKEKIQRRNRFYFYFLLLIICIVISFLSGYKTGREVEKSEWLELVNKPECECLKLEKVNHPN